MAERKNAKASSKGIPDTGTKKEKTVTPTPTATAPTANETVYEPSQSRPQSLGQRLIDTGRKIFGVARDGLVGMKNAFAGSGETVPEGIKRTKEDWEKLLGTTPQISQQEYEKRLRNAELKAELLNTGRGVLSNIGKIIDRARANYNTAISPTFGFSVRDTLGIGPQAQAQRTPYIAYIPGIGPVAMGQGQGYGYGMMRGPQYPAELSGINTVNAYNVGMNQNRAYLEAQAIAQGLEQQAAMQAAQTAGQSGQVYDVFRLNGKDNEEMKVGTYASKDLADAQIKLLTDQGIKAFAVLRDGRLKA